jgi:hypothetical protein
MGRTFMIGFSFGTGNENAELSERSFIFAQNPFISSYHIRVINYPISIKRFFRTFIFRNNGLHKCQNKLSLEILYIINQGPNVALGLAILELVACMETANKSIG